MPFENGRLVSERSTTVMMDVGSRSVGMAR
jgi:hypothetical protein